MQDLLLEGSGGGKLPPTPRTMVASSDDGEFEAIMMNNNMFHETREDFATPFSEDVKIEKGGW
tara:strand:+ start:2866 stop:3054 length:189 start_codon:yes stop_codon:yes gene_type:complete